MWIPLPTCVCFFVSPGIGVTVWEHGESWSHSHYTHTVGFRGIATGATVLEICIYFLNGVSLLINSALSVYKVGNVQSAETEDVT